jgi:hypothetical protein
LATINGTKLGQGGRFNQFEELTPDRAGRVTRLDVLLNDAAVVTPPWPPSQKQLETTKPVLRRHDC